MNDQNLRAGAYTKGAGKYGLDVLRVLAERRRKWYAGRAKSGGCVRCKGEAAPGRVFCVPCAEKNAATLRAKRAADKLSGTCVRCHVDPARPGLTHCEGCKYTKRRKRA